MLPFVANKDITFPIDRLYAMESRVRPNSIRLCCRQYLWVNVSVTKLTRVSHITDTARVLCAAGSMKRSRVRLSVCLSVPSIGVRRVCVCCWALRGQEISINSCRHRALSSNGAATRRTTATAGRAMLTAEGRGSRGFCMGLKHYSDAILFEFESAPSPEEEEVIPWWYHFLPPRKGGNFPIGGPGPLAPPLAGAGAAHNTRFKVERLQ